MPSIDWSNTEIQAALISGMFTVLSAAIAAIAAALIGQNIADRRKLKRDLAIAFNDIAFLLEVEELHCENNEKAFGKSGKNTVRKNVRKASGLSFSQKFTPGRIRARGIAE